jgi:hypothetical protein
LPSFHFLGEHQLKTGGDLVHLDYQQNVNRNLIDYLGSAVSRTSLMPCGNITEPSGFFIASGAVSMGAVPHFGPFSGDAQL